ncbi:hypothetical protein [Planctomycetes bacterium Poly30]
MAPSFLCVSSLALAGLPATSLALAQSSTSIRTASERPAVLTAEPARIPSIAQVRDAGAYHVATGTWTRRGVQQRSPIGPDVIYANTAMSGYFSSAGGAGGFAPLSTNVDEGFIPARGNPEYPLADRSVYTVDGFQINYCDLGAAATGGWDISFYESYVPCASPPAPTASVLLNGLPATGCWTLFIDLSGGQEFDFAGEGGGAAGTQSSTSFGWSYRYIGTDGTAPAGFILAGDPASTDPGWITGGLPTDGTETYYGPASLCGGSATGNRTQDSWGLINPTGANCWWFGGYSNTNGCGVPFQPYASFFMEIYAQSGPGSAPVGAAYCSSNPNSTGVNTTLAMSGSDSASANDVLLAAGELPLGSVGVFVTSMTQGSTPNFMGSQGNLCLGGTLGYLTGPGQVRSAGLDGSIRIDTTLGTWDVSAIPAGAGTYAAAAGVTSNFQLWHRDVVASAPTSNFSDAVSVTWSM